MVSWFNTPDRVRALQEAAESWVGTPFVANSRCKGERGGVSCQMLAEQVYKEAGVPISFSVPSGSMRWSGVSNDSLIARFLTGHNDLLDTIDNPVLSDIVPGDLIGFKVGKCLHHVGVALPGGKFIHCMRGMSTLICPVSDPTFSSRLARLWRIKP